MSRRWLQFRLRTLLLAPMAVAIVLVTYPVWSEIDLRPAERRPIAWQPFSPEAVEQAQAEGRPVLVQFCADWHPTTAYMWKVVLESPSVRRYVADYQVVPLLADGTEYDEELFAAMKSYGIPAIPGTVIHSPQAGSPPIVLEGFASQKQVLSALRRSTPPSSIPPGWVPVVLPLFGVLAAIFLIGLAHVLARMQPPNA